MIFFVYVICLGAGFLFTLLAAVMGHVFGHDGHVVGSHGSVEAGEDGSDSSGVSAFSPTIIAAFVTAFGGLGLIFTQVQATKSPLISAPLAIVGALGIASLIVSVLRQLFAHTQSSSESHVAALVGVCANIISPIPANGVGEIAYVQGGSRYSAPAREVTGQPVAVGQTVKIAKIIGSQFYVTIIN